MKSGSWLALILALILISALGLFCIPFSCTGTGDPWVYSSEDSIPVFPWPPPQASASEVIPQDMLISLHGTTLLRDVDSRLTEALDQNGYSETSYYAVPGGFALVTKLEQIEANGTSRQDSRRWTLVSRPFKFSLSTYIRAIFSGTPGFYRVIVFIVTPFAFKQTRIEFSHAEVEAWFGDGLNRLPDSIGQINCSRDRFTCTALIYELNRLTETDEPEVQIPGLISGRTHLVNAGIWEAMEKWR